MIVTEVAVNLMWCDPGRVGGSEEYLVRQLQGLIDVPDGAHRPWSPTLFCSRGFADAHPELVDVVRTEVGPPGIRRRAVRVGAEHSWLAWRTRRFPLVHHGGGTSPAIGTQPSLLTVHDLQFLTHPGYHSRVKLGYLRTVVPRSIARATAVAVPTEWVRSAVVETYAKDPALVTVVRHGIEPDLGRDAAPPEDLRDRYDLGDGPVLVFPAITHPHKGHRFLLETMARSWTDPDLRLVLLGGAGAAEVEVERTIHALGLGDRVRRPGRVSAADRDGLVELATALVFPSEYEGFGAPVLEAMALGTPVICTDQPALAEVVGAAGLVLPREAEAWASAPEEVERRRDELVAAGRARADRYTAAAAGADLARAYDLAADASR